MKKHKDPIYIPEIPKGRISKLRNTTDYNKVRSIIEDIATDKEVIKEFHIQNQLAKNRK